MRRTSIGPDGAERLGRIALFEGLSYGQRQMLARVADQVLAAAGETIMSQGEAGYEFMVLEDGTAQVIQDGARVRVMPAGDFFGELSVLKDGAPRTASVVALSDVRALVFTAHYMREMHERVPELRERIDRAASERLERDAQASA
jgi:CRP-like cAMP-binding protein